MTRFVLRRLFWAIPVLLIASVLVFIASAPRPTRSGRHPRNPPRPEALVEVQARPRPRQAAAEQYFDLVESHFVRGNLGQSLTSQTPGVARPPERRSRTRRSWARSPASSRSPSASASASSRPSASTRGSTTSRPGSRSSASSMPPFFFGSPADRSSACTFTKWFHPTRRSCRSRGIYSPGHDGFDLSTG